jgi:hypothetical protein
LNSSALAAIPCSSAFCVEKTPKAIQISKPRTSAEARHTADHVARMLKPYPLGHIHANRQTDEGRNEGGDEEDDTDNERCREHRIGQVKERGKHVRGPKAWQALFRSEHEMARIAAHRNGVAVVVGMVVDDGQRVSENALSFGLKIGVQNC